MERFDWKRALRAAGLLLALALFGGAALFLLLLFGMLGAFPLYVTYGCFALGCGGLLAAFLLGCGYLPRRGRRWVGRGLVCLLAAVAVFIGRGVYRDRLPTLDDRQLLLWQYEPFAQDTKAASLTGPPDLRLDDFTARHLRLDGATALYPVYAGFVQAVYPPGTYPLYEQGGSLGRVACSGTTEAYARLIAREADVIFAAAPSQAQQAEAEAAGLTLHLTPIGREAFVFFVNSKNPVSGLTVAEVQGIYTGDITNWRQVGGENRAIRPFQRAEGSGSQSALQRLMEGLPLLEPEEEDRIAGMGGIIREVASYRNYPGAIGFSFRFYATEMVENRNIRLLALDGVAPDKERIRDGTYPISSAFYAVTAAPIGQPPPQEADAALSAFFDWMLSDQGQEIVERSGYVALG